MMPRVKSWTPEKIEMVEARKGKPGRLTGRGATHDAGEDDDPEDVTMKPDRLASWSGAVPKPVAGSCSEPRA